MRILVADDHPMVRDAMARALAAFDPGVEVVEAADLDGALALAAQAPCAVALIDLNMPGMDGLAGVQRLRAGHPALPLIVVSGQSDAGTARAALEAGASGFVPKTEPVPRLLQALQVVSEGGVFVPPHAVVELRVGGAAAQAAPGAPREAPALTPRQADVLGLLLQGQPNKTIAARLGLAEGTVKLHIAAVLRALHARNRTEAVVRARELGWPAT